MFTWKEKPRTGFVRKGKCVHVKECLLQTGSVRQKKCSHVKVSLTNGYRSGKTWVSQKIFHSIERYTVTPSREWPSTLIWMPTVRDQVYYVTEFLHSRWQVQGCGLLNEDELLSVELVDDSGLLN